MVNKFTFKVIEHKEMTPAELETSINQMYKQDHNSKWFFFFNGDPFSKASFLEDVDDNGLSYMIFKITPNMSSPKFIKNHYRETVNGKRVKINANEITGYDLVDVYNNGWYIGSYWNITTK